MLGNIFLLIFLFVVLILCWHFISSIFSGSEFNIYKHVSFFAVLVKEHDHDFIRSWVKIFFMLVKLILLAIIIRSLDFFSFTENPDYFIGSRGVQITYAGLFYGVVVWEILSAIEYFFEEDIKKESTFEILKKPLFFLLFLFSFSSYYQTPFSDYVVLRQREELYYGILNLGCISHIFFFLLFYFYISHDLKRLGSSIIQHKIGLLSNIIGFAKIFILQIFLIYAFLGWTSQVPLMEIVTDRFPNSGAIFEVLSLLAKLICVHLCGFLGGQFLGNINSRYVCGIERYLQLLSGVNALLLIGIRLW